jgi:hypothetical protein
MLDRRYSEYATALTIEESRFDSQQGQKYFSLLNNV